MNGNSAIAMKGELLITVTDMTPAVIRITIAELRKLVSDYARENGIKECISIKEVSH